MSAPDTGIETQKRRHRGPLIGMAVAVIVGVSFMTFWLFGEVATADDPQINDAQVEGQDFTVSETETDSPGTPTRTDDPAAAPAPPDPLRAPAPGGTLP